MSPAVLEAVGAKIVASDLVADCLNVLWHAGEPLLAGTGFYQRAVQVLASRAPHRKVVHTVQTNGTLIDREWAEFFVEHEFRVGVSIDGPTAIHDGQRVRWSGAGSHEQTMRGVRLLRDAGLSPGALCVLTATSLKQPGQLLDFFLENGFPSVAFNVEEVENTHRSSSVSRAGDDYRKFIDEFFTLWWPYRDQLQVREFDDIGQVALELRSDPQYRRPVVETDPLGIVTVGRNGDLYTYSPEFVGTNAPEFDGFVIGNVLAISDLADVVADARFVRLRDEVNLSIQACEPCAYFNLCGGGFFSNKYAEHGTLRVDETTTCRLHRKVLIDSVLTGLERIACV